MNEKLVKKFELCILGGVLSMANILLIDTRFNIVGLGFGLAAIICYIKALRIKNE